MPNLAALGGGGEGRGEGGSGERKEGSDQNKPVKNRYNATSANLAEQGFSTRDKGPVISI